MIKKLDEIILNYSYYHNQDIYSDGDIEDVLLEACQNGTCDELLYNSNQWPVLYHLSNIRENLLEWYPFEKDGSLLEIGSGCGALTGLFSRKVKCVTCVELSERRSLINAYRHRECDNIEILLGNFQDIEPSLGKYNYIALIGVWEYSKLYINSDEPFIDMLTKMKKHLFPNGKIIIAIENKMGIKYWNGAVEDHIGKMYCGLNDYVDEIQPVRTFSKVEVENMLKEAGLDEYIFYYPMPDYKLPETIYTDEILPVPGMERNYGKDYNASHVYNFNDAVVTDQICFDNMFSYFANSFLVITGEKEGCIKYVKYNRERQKEFCCKTEIISDKEKMNVVKSALYECGKNHILKLKSNEEKWNTITSGIQCISGEIIGNRYVTPYIDGVELETYFYTYRNNAKKFVEEFKKFMVTIFSIKDDELIPFSASERFCNIFGEVYPSKKKSLRYTNIDLIFSNIKITSSNEICCFDPEWVFDFTIPIEFIAWRMATHLYDKYRIYLRKKMTIERFIEQIGISNEDGKIYANMWKNFMNFVFGTEGKKNYLINYRKAAIMQQFKIT